MTASRPGLFLTRSRHLRARPTLSVTVNGARSGPVPVTLSYLTPVWVGGPITSRSSTKPPRKSMYRAGSR